MEGTTPGSHTRGEADRKQHGWTTFFNGLVDTDWIRHSCILKTESSGVATGQALERGWLKARQGLCCRRAHAMLKAQTPLRRFVNPQQMHNKSK